MGLFKQRVRGRDGRHACANGIWLLGAPTTFPNPETLPRGLSAYRWDTDLLYPSQHGLEFLVLWKPTKTLERLGAAFGSALGRAAWPSPVRMSCPGEVCACAFSLLLERPVQSCRRSFLGVMMWFSLWMSGVKSCLF